jgi:hypothetical protein
MQETNLYPTGHFIERLLERFGEHYYSIPFNKLEWVSLTTPNRYEHVNIMWKLVRWAEREPGVNHRYLVSKEYNIVIPVSEKGLMITANYYHRSRKRNKTKEEMEIS